MFRILIHWVLAALLLMALMRLVPGFFEQSLNASMLVAVAIALANAIMGFVLKQTSFPLAIVLFLMLICAANVAMIMFASEEVDGFYVYNLSPALWTAGALTVLALVMRLFMKGE